MAALIQRVARQALSTFRAEETAAFSSNFDRLKNLVSETLAIQPIRRGFRIFGRFRAIVHEVMHERAFTNRQNDGYIL